MLFLLYMTTLTIDILDDKALSLIKDLELLKIIRVRKDKLLNNSGNTDMVAKYKGAMTQQPLDEVDQQLNELRNGWE